MPCSPADYSIPPPDFDEPAIAGFGIPSVPDAEIPGIPVPEGFPEDLLELLETLKLYLPSGKFQPNLNPNIDKTLIDGIVKLLDLLLPFLAIYKMILPILNMIICIIEVLCALTNPFKLIKALRRLFRTCIPDFLSLFPIFAMILLIISLILLILALIEYIISEIIRIINQLLKNLRLLARIAKRKDTRSALTAMRKIGSLLCFLKNLFSVLQIVALIIQVIKDILRLFFRIPPCDDSDTSEDGCCTPEVCPAFIKAGDFTKTTGTLQYLREIGQDASSISGMPASFGPIFASLGAIRQESWQFYDDTLAGQFMFYNITAPVDVDATLGFTFFPAGKAYDAATSTFKVPYTVDLRFFYDPAVFGLTDTLGSRFIRIKNCIVQKTPDLKLKNWNNAEIDPSNGILSLIGGKVTEDDGSTPVLVNGVQGTLNTFIHLANQISDTLVDNALVFTDIEYTFKINHGVLVGEQLISLGCVPDVAFDRTFVNANVGAALQFNGSRLGALPIPDPADTTACINTAITKLSQNVTAATAAIFQAEATSCLRSLGDQLTALLDDLVDLGFCSYKSKFTLAPAIQFTTQPILVTATLNDVNGNNLCPALPASAASEIAEKIVPEATFGNITKFSYDGSANFTAEIESDVEGTGELKLMYNNVFFSTLTIPANLTQTPITTPQVLTYEFIKTPVGAGDSGGKPRRDEGDVGGSSG